MLERLITKIPGSETVTEEMKKAFRHLVILRPDFDDIKIDGLYVNGSEDLVLGCRQVDRRGVGALYEPANPLYTALDIYPVQGAINGLRFERGSSLNGCALKREESDGFVVSVSCLVGMYRLPHYAILKISKEPVPVN